jgi:hypothetical protein
VSQDENHDNENLFHDSSNATYANQDDNKSTLGYVFLPSGGVWKSKKQSVITLSATKSEYVALLEAGMAQKFIWQTGIHLN